MNTNNPYEPPQGGFGRGPAGPYGPTPAPPNRLPFILAGLGALAASGFWAALTLMLGAGVSTGSVSPTQVILPLVLIVLYAFRGFQLFKGNMLAARSMLWLQGVGGAMAVLQLLRTDDATVKVLYGLKLAIHVFGAATAYFAYRAGQERSSFSR